MTEAVTPTGDETRPEETETPEQEEQELEQEADEAKAEEAAAETAEEEEKARRKHEKVQRRINQLTREKKEAQEEASKLRTQLAEQSKPVQPKPDDYDDEHAYIDAQVEYRLSLEKQETPKRQEQAGPNFKSIVDSGKEKYKDFEAVAMSDQNLTQQVAETVAMADNADDIFYHLGKNPVELERISLLSPREMAREVGRLEITVTKPPSRTTSTPPPAKPVESAPSADVDMSKLSTDEWMRRRNQARWKNGKV